MFTKNRDRLQNGEVFAKFMVKLLHHPQVKPLLSDEHFSVDGTLIEAWASQKSFRPKDGSGDADGGANFHGQQRKNDTHASTTDPDCRLYRKAAGREATLCYMGHATMENRHGLAVVGVVTLANGTAERRAAETMLKSKAKAAGHRITVGEDKAYDSADHVAKLRALNVTPHVAQNDAITATGKHRRSAVDRRTTRHEGYGMSQSRRAMTECIFGWGKQHGTMRKTKHRGIAAVAADFLLNLIAYNSDPHSQTGRGIGMRPITHHPPYFKARLISLSQSPSLTGQNNDSISSFFRKLLKGETAVFGAQTALAVIGGARAKSDQLF